MAVTIIERVRTAFTEMGLNGIVVKQLDAKSPLVLSGTTANKEDKQRAEQIVKSFAEVPVVNNIVVTPPKVNT